MTIQVDITSLLHHLIHMHVIEGGYSAPEF